MTTVRARQHAGQSYEPGYFDLGNGDASGPREATGTCGFVIKCGACHHATYGGKPSDHRLPPEAVHQLFRKQGWIVGARHPSANRCPRCQHSPKPAKEQTMPTLVPKDPPAVLPILPRSLNGKEMRLVSGLLDEHFDDKLGSFDPEWSDERIATQIDVPRAAVVKLREEGWGVIKVDRVIEGLKSEAASLRAMLVDFERRIGAIEKPKRDRF